MIGLYKTANFDIFSLLRFTIEAVYGVFGLAPPVVLSAEEIDEALTIVNEALCIVLAADEESRATASPA